MHRAPIGPGPNDAGGRSSVGRVARDVPGGEAGSVRQIPPQQVVNQQQLHHHGLPPVLHTRGVGTLRQFAASLCLHRSGTGLARHQEKGTPRISLVNRTPTAVNLLLLPLKRLMMHPPLLLTP
jgi:hypothetical protein